MKNIILLTAPPRTGKSTLIKKIIQTLGEKNLCGFFTEEIHRDGERVGFKIKELNGDEFVFSHVDIVSDYKISRYNVDLEKFENFIDNVFSKIDNDKILIIDEIGPMQCLSSIFKKKITELFNRPTVVLGTVFYQNFEWIDDIKKSDKVELIELNLENRDCIASEIVDKLKEISNHYNDIKETLAKKEIKSKNYYNLFNDAKFSKDNKIKIKTEHGIREIFDDPILGIKCTCDFYKIANTCSHIMAYQNSKKNRLEKSKN